MTIFVSSLQINIQNAFVKKKSNFFLHRSKIKFKSFFIIFIFLFILSSVVKSSISRIYRGTICQINCEIIEPNFSKSQSSHIVIKDNEH
jgi:hypothetical protein